MGLCTKIYSHLYSCLFSAFSCGFFFWEITLYIRISSFPGYFHQLKKMIVHFQKHLPGISGRAQPSTFLLGTLMTFSAAQSPFCKTKFEVKNIYCLKSEKGAL